MAWIAVAVVVVLVGVLVGVKVAGGSSGGSERQPAPAAAVARITTVPAATLASGAAKVGELVALKPGPGTPLTSGGKPEVLFIGAEFCPICATERWPLTVALSQFGTFSNLQKTHSAVQDGNIQTLSYYGSTYTSPYISFVPVETYTNQVSGSYYGKLQTPTAAQQALWTQAEGSQLGFPFVDFGGKYLLETSQFPDTALSGMSFSDIVSTVGTNDNTVGAAIDASAAVLTKDICTLTGQQPSQVCKAVANVSVASPPSDTGSSTPAGS